MYELKPDFEDVQKRMQAFWHQDVWDRPMAVFNLQKPAAERVPTPVSHHASPDERWMDTEYLLAYVQAALSNQLFMGDSLPIAWPNLGPEVMSAMYGCPLHFGDYGTSWSDPILSDWANVDQVRLDWNSPYLRKLHEMTDALLAAGKDWHPGGDCVAAFRDPMNLAIDMIHNKEQIVDLLTRVEADYFKLYNVFYDKLHAAGQPITAWLPLFDNSKFYIPSNDFSIMVSDAMFREVFLPGIVRECQFLDRSFYHLDGPGALHHLEAILAIPELDGLQFVPGAGNEGFSKWVRVYQKAQAAGKSIYVELTPGDINLLMDTLKPGGVMLAFGEIDSADSASAILKTLEAWVARPTR
jgi:hypothetical protein